MNREKVLVISVFIFSFLIWLLDVSLKYHPNWQRLLSATELINLTGVLAFIPMGLIMLLALRFSFLENKFRGLDKIYYVHKWLGIICIIFVFLHYIVKLNRKIINEIFVNGIRVDSDKLTILSSLRGDAKIVGEVLFYLFIIMLIATLLHKIPYRNWKYIHKTISIMFIGVVFHTIILMPARYWLEPIGLVTILLSITGVYASIISLCNLIGKTKQFETTISAIKYHNQIVYVTCKLKNKWQCHAGQYVFLKHQGSNESHPYTIASYCSEDETISFAIKPLGHYTNQIKSLWKIGDKIRVEGPYGRFFFTNSPLSKQIWIAGGVGITPFIAWLEYLNKAKINKNITLYYCVNREDDFLMLEYLKNLSQNTGVILKPHCFQNDGFLPLETLPIDKDTTIFFCGPTGFSKAIEKQIKAKKLSISKHFYKEYFNMR